MSEPRTNLRLSGVTVLAAGALVALAAWPAYLHAQSAGVAPVPALTAAPVKPDWRLRDANITFLESRSGKIANDAIVPRMLSGEYLQRYRERGDVGDVLRAEHAARLALRAQPRNNAAGEIALAGALLTLHRFAAASEAVRAARSIRPDVPAFAAEEAGLALEVGDVERARRLIGTFAGDPSFDIVAARLDEETGHLDRARALLAGAQRRADANYDTPAERRAWYHARSAELAFAAGDHDAVRREATTALAMFPQHLRALAVLARVDLADGRTAEAEDAARRAVAVQPNPEVLGYLADAQAAHGAVEAAAATRDEIAAVERVGNAQRVNDRLIAVWEADHGVRVADAYAIARRELAARDDVYAEDTLAWSAARSGHPEEARAAIRRALRYDTEDARLQYHAGVIAAQAGDAAEARRRLARALALDPRFSAPQAADARARLAALGDR